MNILKATAKKAVEKTDGWKSYGSAAGLICLALYQAYNKDFEQSVHTVFMALGVIGLRHAISKHSKK
jgi:hypothetical protein